MKQRAKKRVRPMMAVTVDTDVLKIIDELAERKHGGNRSRAMDELVRLGAEVAKHLP